MSALLLSGQIEPVRPLAVRSWFMRNGEGDLAALKTICDAFAVPSWVAGGGGTIGSQRANLSDYQVEQCVRDAIWRLVNYTGTADSGGTAVPTNQRALDIYNWINTNAALHSGLGPTIDCGNIMAMYVGFLAAYGIPARRVWTHDGTSHLVDFSAEYWSPTWGWVRTGPHINVQAQWTATGNPASLMAVQTVGAQLGSLSGVIHHVPQGGSISAGFRSNIAENLDTMIDWGLWGRGDRLQFATGAAGDPNQTDDGNLAANLISLLPQTANAYATQTSALYPFVVAARDLTDVSYTPSALSASARLTPAGLAEVALDAVMLDTGITYQVKPPSGSWTALLSPAHTFYPVTGQAWQYRAVGPRGNTTNVVTVTVA